MARPRPSSTGLRGIVGYDAKLQKEAFSRAIQEVRAIYAEQAARPIERDCLRRTECCQFKLTGRTPLITRGEALVATAAVRAAGLKQLPKPVLPGACPLLKKDGKCWIYADRPFGCRTHFCSEAGGPQSRGEVIDLIHKLETIDEKLGGSGPRAIYDAIDDELNAGR